MIAADGSYAPQLKVPSLPAQDITTCVVAEITCRWMPLFAGD